MRLKQDCDYISWQQQAGEIKLFHSLICILNVMYIYVEWEELRGGKGWCGGVNIKWVKQQKAGSGCGIDDDTG